MKILIPIYLVFAITGLIMVLLGIFILENAQIMNIGLLLSAISGFLISFYYYKKKKQ